MGESVALFIALLVSYFIYLCPIAIFCFIIYYLASAFMRKIILFCVVLPICVVLGIYEPLVLLFSLYAFGLTALIWFIIIKISDLFKKIE